MTIAVLGATGLLGKDLVSVLQKEEVDFISVPRTEIDASSTVLELQKKLSKFEFVINCIGSTHVDQIELDPTNAIHVNAEFVNKLAISLIASDTHLIQISSNFVFDGEKTSPYSTSDTTCPINAYGLTKALAEKYLLESDCNSTIVRTGWLYGSTSMDFPKLVASNLVLGKKFHAADDQYGQPTWTRDLAEFILGIIMQGSNAKIVHGVSSGKASKFDLARKVEECLGIKEGELVFPCASSDFSTAARRPSNSTLETSHASTLMIGDWSPRFEAAFSSVLDDYLR